MAKKINFHNQPRLPFEEFDDPDYEAAETSHGYSPRKNDAAVAEGDAPGHERLMYVSFGSGSSGNSCYIGTDRGGIVIDAGIRAEKIEEMMKQHGLSMRSVKALLLTHDHSDHVRYAYALLRSNRHMELFCTPRVLNGMFRRHNVSRRIKDYHHPIFKEIPFKIGRMEITAFEVPHDGSDNMGFSIDFAGHRFVLATDLGEVADRARHYMSQANYLVIEANYDLDMLRNGRYPEYLKARIRTSNGHLDNEQTATFLKDIINPDLKYIFLCHLSQDNNTPAKALRAVRQALEEKRKKVGDAEVSRDDTGNDVQLMALPRFDATRLFVFRK